MSKFATKHIKAIAGRQRFEELVILNDNVIVANLDLEQIPGQLELYEQSLEVKYKSHFKSLLAYMELVANLESLPETKFRDVTPKGEQVKEYEFKYRDLRVYGIKIPNGKLILLGGYKSRQTDDFKKFRSIKRQYLSSIS